LQYLVGYEENTFAKKSTELQGFIVWLNGRIKFEEGIVKKEPNTDKGKFA
jgi:hypothetical protein